MNQLILDFLKEHGQATGPQIARELMTPMGTIQSKLSMLKKLNQVRHNGVAYELVQRKETSGRVAQHVVRRNKRVLHESNATQCDVYKDPWGRAIIRAAAEMVKE